LRCICVVSFVSFFIEQSSSHRWGVLHNNRRK
jgi:hypothetical protein